MDEIQEFESVAQLFNKRVLKSYEKTEKTIFNNSTQVVNDQTPRFLAAGDKSFKAQARGKILEWIIKTALS